MLRRIFIVGAVMTLVVPVAGQTQQLAVPPAPVPAADGSVPDDPAKPSVVMFELGLQRAIEAGGQKFAQRALQAVPGLVLMPSSEPIVRGYPVPEYGFAFEVQIPEILDSGMQLLNMINQQRTERRPPLAGAAQAQAARPIGNGTTGAANTVTADPMTNSPVLDFANEAAANAFYTSCVKDALLDAMIDNSVALPLTDRSTLMLVLSGIERMGPNPLYRTRERKLILTLKGSDLTEYRAGKLVRDQVKERIAERRW